MVDVTDMFLETCSSYVDVRERHAGELRLAEGNDEYDEQQEMKRGLLEGVTGGLLRRSLGSEQTLNRTHHTPEARLIRPSTMIISLACSVVALPLAAQQPPQTQTDDYTRYELQEPGTAGFRIFYDVTATTAGARFYYNTIRAGAEEEVHHVTDLHTGRSLDWEVVDGTHARENGHPRANPESRYIKVTLARPVPEGGQGRIRIDKTYWDHESYYEDGNDVIVFDRSLGIRRNAVVLPVGYELIGANYPVQVETEADARLRLSFMNPGPGAIPLRVQARLLTGGPAPTGRSDAASEPVPASGGGSPARARVDYVVPERAFQDRDITYFLNAPETNSFRLFHDYTESRPGMDRYVNVVRAGSSASDPEAYNLDTGARLEVEQLRGAAIAEKGIELGATADADTEVVVIWFDAVSDGASVRLRIWETYTDPGRYLLSSGEFVWDRNFGRPRNTVVLPEGWHLTASSIPGVIDETPDGRIRIRYVNGRPDGIQVFLKGRRR